MQQSEGLYAFYGHYLHFWHYEKTLGSPSFNQTLAFGVNEVKYVQSEELGSLGDYL